MDFDVTITKIKHLQSRGDLYFYYAFKAGKEQKMKDYILNKVVLKTGDSLDIVESSTLPLTERLMYKVEHEKDKIIVRRDGGKMVIPVDNILFASSIPLDVIHEDFDDEI